MMHISTPQFLAARLPSRSVIGEDSLGLGLLPGEEAGHALHLVVGLEAAAEDLLLDLHALVDGHLHPLVDGLLAGAHGDGGVLGDLAGHLQRGVQQLRLGDDGVDQADAQGLGGVDVPGGVQQLLGHAQAHDAGQALGAAEAGGDAQAHLGLAEHGVVGADADVAGHGQLAPAAQSEPVDRSDHGLGQILQTQEHPAAVDAELLAVDGGEAFHLADIGARHEALVPFAGEDHAANGVLVDGLEGGLQVGQHLGVQGVEGLGAVDGEHGHSALLLGFHE